MKKSIIVFFTVLSLVLSISCTKENKEVSPNSKLAGSLKIAGGTAHLKVMKEIAKKLLKENSELKISVAGGGSGVGIKSVGEGIVDIGNSGRDLKSEEIKKYGLVAHKIAIDGISVIVKPENKVKELSFEQIKDIFSGKISNWKEIGGNDEKINIYTRDSKSGTRKTFAKLGLKKGSITNDAIIVTSNGNMKQAISNDINGIGYMSIGYLDETVKGISVEGIEPTLANVKSGAYKIQRYLLSVTRGEAKGLAKAFLELLLSKEGQEVVSKFHFIPVK